MRAQESTADLQEAAFHGLRWSTIARPTSELIQLGSIVVLARLITPAEFGRYAVALIAQEIAIVIVSGGLNGALVQRERLDRSHLQAGAALALISGVCLALLMLAAASLVVTPVFGARTASFVRLMSPLCLISAVSTVPTAMLSRRMAFRRVNEMEVANTVIRCGTSIALALAGLHGEALVLGVLAGACTAGLIATLSAPPPLPRLRRQPARELLDYALPASAATVSWIGFSNVDYAIIGARLGAVQTGLYFRAYSIAVEYQKKISVVMSQVGFPVLSRTGSAENLARVHREMVGLLTLVLFPLLALLAVTAPTLVPFVFGKGWTSAVVPVQVLAAGGAATLVIDAAGTALMAMGRPRALLGFGLGHFFAYGLSVYLVVPLGLVAVAVDAAVVHTAFLVIAYALMLQGSPERPLRRLWGDVAPAVTASAGLVGAALPVYLGAGAAGFPPLPRLLCSGLAAGLAYPLTVRALFPTVWRVQAATVSRILPRRGRVGVRRPGPATAESQPAAIGT
jgi:O-antigen/teichoic acid export membrane protein